MADYPTEVALETIRTWPGRDIAGLMAYIYDIWTYAGYGRYWVQTGPVYAIATGGWSGNEEIIAAMQDNKLFWMLYWTQSRRGGKYIFGAPVPANQSQR